MALDIPPPGTVFEYPYRWASEAADDRSPDGSKSRTVCLVLTVRAADERHVLYLLAVSSKPPRQGQIAIRAPETERRRGGLARYPDAWVYVSEFNRDVAENSYYFEPNAVRLGAFSAVFLRVLAQALAERISSR